MLKTEKHEDEILNPYLKEIKDYKYALDESSIVAITDQKGIIKHVNANFCRISKYLPGELIGQDHRIINSGYHPTEFIRDLWVTIASGKIWRGELKNKAKDGSTYWVDTTIVPFLNEVGKPYQYLAIRSDITGRKEAEEFLVQRTEQLETANNELANQNEETEKRSVELISAHKNLLAFTHISGHDLQEPLRKIQTFVSIILQNEIKNLSENGKYNFQRILLVVERMRQLMEGLLSFSRIAPAEFEKTDLNIVLEKVKVDLADIIKEKHASIKATMLCSVNIIAFQFHQLMYNLISNALKFSKPGVPCQISITSRTVNGSELDSEKFSSKGNYCHITIKDNGIGFEPHFSDRIFGVFQKLHAKEVYAGTGIGLAIVKKIVENHSGIITATSELNKGATFDIYIPSN